MKILLLSNLTSYTYNFRLEIIQAFLAAGNEVTIACHNDNEGKQQELISIGCRMIEVPFDGKGTKIREELKLVRTYSRLISYVKPEIVFSFTIKMNLYGGLMAYTHKVPFVPMITGLGELERTGKLRALLMIMHKFVMPKAKCVIFQNNENRLFFAEHGIRTRSTIVVPGSGINLQKYEVSPYPDGDRLVFSFIGRLTEAKGIRNYFEAAERLASESMEFHAAGRVDSEFKGEVERLCKAGKLVYEGELSDVRDLLKRTNCLILPTFHPEGMSNVILESCAMGRPVICTARTGCKEIVQDSVNGLFCEAKDSDNLVAIINRFSEMTNEKRRGMGLAGRSIVEEKFNRRIVVDAYMGIIAE